MTLHPPRAKGLAATSALLTPVDLQRQSIAQNVHLLTSAQRAPRQQMRH